MSSHSTVNETEQKTRFFSLVIHCLSHVVRPQSLSLWFFSRNCTPMTFDRNAKLFLFQHVSFMFAAKITNQPGQIAKSNDIIALTKNTTKSVGFNINLRIYCLEFPKKIPFTSTLNQRYKSQCNQCQFIDKCNGTFTCSNTQTSVSFGKAESKRQRFTIHMCYWRCAKSNWFRLQHPSNVFTDLRINSFW